MGAARRTEVRQIGSYVVTREVRGSGPGRVYLGERSSGGEEVVIKELVVSPSLDAAAVTHFMREAELMARAAHPNIVRVHDLEQVGDVRYIVLEHVEGTTLREIITAGDVPLLRVFVVMHGVLRGLDHAHSHNIVHLDLRPENILVSRTGEVKITDFGIARLADDPRSSTASQPGPLAATPQYMSPEQVAGGKIDARSDLYSAGIVLYELVCGTPPFAAAEIDRPFSLMAKHVQSAPPPPSVRRPGLDPELESLILKALSKRPEDRYQSANDFDRALVRIADRLAPGWDKGEATAAAPRATTRRWRWPFGRR
jgi:serine/threonine-protein kinase